MWIKKSMPALPGYESLGDSAEAKRWLDFNLGELLAADDDLLDYITSKTPGSGLGIETREDICNFVISAFDYPMVRGIPTDCHRNNWFSGLSCHQVTQDFFQTASETLRTLRLNQRIGKKGYGDCEDCAALFVTLFLMKKWQAWDCIGAVYQNARLLGYHSFAIFEGEAENNRLYEATLSEPPAYPSGYPKINPEATEWQVGPLTYQGFAKFNREEYYENEEAEDPLKALRIGLRGKETRKKHEAITKAWGIKTKPLRRPGLLTKLRWR
ncbi:unnamed protein product [marine sediment metagenome]|uniref:Uncharacterized protein n=1 Tax=marine sediment metagenome TaxID=412755 RepID=X1KI61_9ZZZZ